MNSLALDKVLAEKGIRRITDYSPIEYEELIFLQGSDFEKIFGAKDGSPKLNGRLPVVKITNPHNGKSVHLLYQ